MSLLVKLNNLYQDREITGEAFLEPYKKCNRFIHKILPSERLLSKSLRLISQIFLALFLSPLMFIGMSVKCVNVSQVKYYNDKIKHDILYRKIFTDYPGQYDKVYRVPLNNLFGHLNRASQAWDRRACNIFAYLGDDVAIQFISRTPRFQVPQGRFHPFVS